MPSSPLDLKTGVIEIGILISTFLYGIATVQTFIYFHDSARDPRWLKGMVRNVHSDIDIELTFPRWPFSGEDRHLLTKDFVPTYLLGS